MAVPHPHHVIESSILVPIFLYSYTANQVPGTVATLLPNRTAQRHRQVPVDMPGDMSRDCDLAGMDRM